MIQFPNKLIYNDKSQIPNKMRNSNEMSPNCPNENVNNYSRYDLQSQ